MIRSRSVIFKHQTGNEDVRLAKSRLRVIMSLPEKQKYLELKEFVYSPHLMTVLPEKMQQNLEEELQELAKECLSETDEGDLQFALEL